MWNPINEILWWYKLRKLRQEDPFIYEEDDEDDEDADAEPDSNAGTSSTE